MQPRADGKDHVRLAGQRVGGGRADDADRADMGRMVVRDRALAGDGLGDRDAVLRARSRASGLFGAANSARRRRK